MENKDINILYSGDLTFGLSQYNSKSNRNKSFGNDCNNFVPDKESLTEAGFFKLKYGDAVMCYRCGFAMENFKGNVIPIYEHVNNNPKCPILPHIIESEKELERIKKMTSQYIKMDYSVKTLECGTFILFGINIQDVSEDSGRYIYSAVLHKNSIHNVFYLSYLKRNITFENCNFLKIKPEEFTRSGFYYVENKTVKCFSCGVEIRNIEHITDVWAEHIRLREECAYCNAVMGRDDIEALIELGQIYLEEKMDKNDQYDPVIETLSYINIRSRTLRNKIDIYFKYFKEYISSDIFKNCVINTEHGNNIITASIMYCIKTGLYTRIDSSGLVFHIPFYDVLKCNIMSDKKNKILLDSISCVRLHMVDIIDRNCSDEDKYARCEDCKVNYKICKFVPCNHFCFCWKCSEKYEICPKCKKAIFDRIKI